MLCYVNTIRRSGDEFLKVQESTENYLETILFLSQSGEPVRSIDIVNELEYTRPSVSVAMKNLRENGYIETDADGCITLTDNGRNVAESMYERHTLISDWLISLGVEKKTAIYDACRMEHVISQKSFVAMKDHVERWKDSLRANGTDGI